MGNLGAVSHTNCDFFSIFAPTKFLYETVTVYRGLTVVCLVSMSPFTTPKLRTTRFFYPNVRGARNQTAGRPALPLGALSKFQLDWRLLRCYLLAVSVTGLLKHEETRASMQEVLPTPNCSDLDEFVPKRCLSSTILKPRPIYSWTARLFDAGTAACLPISPANERFGPHRCNFPTRGSLFHRMSHALDN
ncbi:unnamed protein product, partial [Ectocarpus sp. 12 AP-2014]